MSIFSKDLFFVNIQCASKKKCIQEMCENFEKSHYIKSAGELFKKIMKREKDFSTGIGKGIAIPHARIGNKTKLKVMIYILDNELDFNAIDDKPVKAIFMVIIPENRMNEYRKILKAISKYVYDESNRTRLFNAKKSDKSSILKELRNEI